MSKRKFDIGDRVRVRRYPEIPLKYITYSGHIGKIETTRHVKGKLWYRVNFGRSFHGIMEEFLAGELTKV